MAITKTKIGLYGGSFNPIHNSHIGIIDSVINKGAMDEVWVMLCKNHPFGKNFVSLEHRIEMLKEATIGMNNVKINYTEVLSEEKSYTSDTLKKLRKEHPDKEFYLILGIDALNDLDKWHDSTYIRKTTPLIIVNREGYPFKHYSNISIEDVVENIPEMSSTNIRERIACGESIHGMVPNNIEKYILEHGLYKDPVVYKNPASTVDLIIVNEKGTLLIKRKGAPFKDYWALPGGYLDCGKEDLETAAVRELKEETSLIANTSDLELVGVYSDPKRDPRGHVISHAYEVKNYSGTPLAADDAKEIGFFKVLPNLAFDHAKILSNFYKKKNEQRLVYELRK